MGRKAIFMKTNSADFPELIKDTHPQIQVAQSLLALPITNQKKANPRHIPKNQQTFPWVRIFFKG